jgi:hypothetical protein
VLPVPLLHTELLSVRVLMSLGVPLHDALHEKQAPHSLCGACSLEVMPSAAGC